MKAVFYKCSVCLKNGVNSILNCSSVLASQSSRGDVDRDLPVSRFRAAATKERSRKKSENGVSLPRQVRTDKPYEQLQMSPD